MATKVAVRYVSRRFSSGAPRRFSSGARKGQKAEDTSASSGGADAKASDSTALTSSTAGVSTDKNGNYAVVAGVVTGLGALGWYLDSKNRVRQETLWKGQKAEYTSASSGGADAKASDSTASTSSTASVSTDKNRNYGVVAGVVIGFGALGLYLKSMNRVHRLHLETLSRVIEFNNNKSSFLFCSEVHVGPDGTIKRFSFLPRGTGPAGPNENLTEIAKKSKTDEPATENGEANDLKLVTLQGKTAGVSTDKNSYYAGVAGVVTGLGGLGWYFENVVDEILSMVHEFNNNTVIELNNKGSGIFCTYVHVGPDGTTMRWRHNIETMIERRTLISLSL